MTSNSAAVCEQSLNEVMTKLKLILCHCAIVKMAYVFLISYFSITGDKPSC